MNLQFTEVCELDKYPPAQDTLVATYQVNLDLAPGERWKELAVKFKDPVKNI